MLYSLIIPVFNRPDHIEALLKCLVKQTFRDFEILIIESGSSIKSDKIVETFSQQINIRYFFKGNDGQGFSRNYGMERAQGDYFVILDSDILLDENYLENLNNHLTTKYLDCFGGPDRLHPDSNNIQKAVNYCMTSIFTTGGTRGQSKSVGKYYPRSFNMGFSRKVYEATMGYKIPYLGEDMELSMRIQALGFSTGLVPTAYVYHERKKTFSGFYKQMHWFGRARINIYSFFPQSLKLIHSLPVGFLLYFAITLISAFYSPFLFMAMATPLILYFAAIFIDASLQYNSLIIGFLSIYGAFLLMAGYGIGFLTDFYKKVLIKKKNAPLSNFSDKKL